jgi:hypothetical protein
MKTRKRYTVTVNLSFLVDVEAPSAEELQADAGLAHHATKHRVMEFVEQSVNPHADALAAFSAEIVELKDLSENPGVFSTDAIVDMASRTEWLAEATAEAEKCKNQRSASQSLVDLVRAIVGDNTEISLRTMDSGENDEFLKNAPASSTKH